VVNIMKKLLHAGIVGPLSFIALFLVEGFTRPGYSQSRNLVSQLATGPLGWMQVLNFLLCGSLVLGCAVGLRYALRGTRGSIGVPLLMGMFAASLLVAGIFVTDPSQGYPVGAAEIHTTHGLIHGFAGLAAFLTLAVTAFAMGWHFSADSKGRRWMIYSIAVGVFILVSFPASFVLSAQLPGSPGGLFQRVTIISGWTWLAAVAWQVARLTTVSKFRSAVTPSVSGADA
jgi:hypothetical membrane protein